MAYAIANRTFGQVIGRCALDLGLNYATGEFSSDGRPVVSGDLLTSVKEIINKAQQHVQDIVGLEKLRERLEFAVAAPITSGATVTIAQESTQVTLSAGIDEENEGRHIRLDGTWFRIIGMANPT